MSLLLALAAASAAAGAPSEAERLARIVAENGMLATIGPVMTASEAREMLADLPELSAAEKATFLKLADETSAELGSRTIAAEAAAFAAQMSLEDLRAIAAFNASPAAARLRTQMPAIMAGTAKALGKVDFKGSLRAKFCAQTGKLCED